MRSLERRPFRKPAGNGSGGVAVATAAKEMTDAQIIGEFEKNSRERVRVSIESWRGHSLVNLRVLWHRDDGEWLPSRKGLAVSTAKLPDLLTLLTQAMKVVSSTWRPAA